jgi:hypothetical protein
MRASQAIPRREIAMYRLDDVAAISRLSRATLYNRIHDGSLETKRVGGVQLVTEEALRRFLKLDGEADG